jgi:hypothetical protein
MLDALTATGALNKRVLFFLMFWSDQNLDGLADDLFGRIAENPFNPPQRRRRRRARRLGKRAYPRGGIAPASRMPATSQSLAGGDAAISTRLI